MVNRRRDFRSEGLTERGLTAEDAEGMRRHVPGPQDLSLDDCPRRFSNRLAPASASSAFSAVSLSSVGTEDFRSEG